MFIQMWSKEKLYVLEVGTVKLAWSM